MPSLGSGEATAVAKHNGFARSHQGCAGCLLRHAASLKYQPLAAGKLDSYFMLRRHRVLVSFCSLGKLVGRRERSQGLPHHRRMLQDELPWKRSDWTSGLRV